MRSIRIALYDLKPGAYDEVVSKANAGIVPLFEASAGFESYAVTQVDETAFASISTWQTREQADTATAKAADWVAANSRELFSLRQNFVGNLTIDTDTRHPAAAVH